MKKYILAIPVMIFPYWLFAALACLYSPVIMENVFMSNGYLLILTLIILWLVSAVFALSTGLLILLKRGQDCAQNAMAAARLNMIVKLVHIPAYVVIFVLSVVFSLTVFGIGFVIFFFFIDCVSIAMTGFIGAASVSRAYVAGCVTLKRGVLLAVLQFLFVADIICCIGLFMRTKRACRKS